MKSIFEYFDYRQYLKEYFDEQKKLHRFFSYRYLGNKVKIDSSALLRISQGSLHLSTKKISKIIEFLKLENNEAKYFENLVYFCRAKTETERKMFFEKLLDLTESLASIIVRRNYKFFTKWQYSAVWSTLNFFQLKDNYQELADFIIPKLTIEEVKESIELLESMNLIELDNKGFYHTTSQNLTTGKEWSSMAIEAYQQEMLALSTNAIKNINRELSDFSTLTINYQSEMFPELKDIIKSFRQSITKLTNSVEGSDQVMQLNIQLFPVSEVNHEK